MLHPSISLCKSPVSDPCVLNRCAPTTAQQAAPNWLWLPLSRQAAGPTGGPTSLWRTNSKQVDHWQSGDRPQTRRLNVAVADRPTDTWMRSKEYIARNSLDLAGHHDLFTYIYNAVEYVCSFGIRQEWKKINVLMLWEVYISQRTTRSTNVPGMR